MFFLRHGHSVHTRSFERHGAGRVIGAAEKKGVSTPLIFKMLLCYNPIVS